ncbi:DUF808 domain-containing protein [Aeromicrobium phragmitis]|uniref:DUF808 domain-containing protein n=1 Tax=Aeromicrobium phragmitis TaxID=2478914 RepID=A0A3L8PS96_9ACTN|nr:DUF808 domain-containing protein [Aeromicrobium phragmitis]RLV57268.1 DUF808 domain-containing protein [Aeromicrobium phragmitis]
MSGGLVALLDDVAALARLAAASVDDIGTAAGRASAKAAGVIVDDAAVTPRYVQGLNPKRELSIIWRIAKGSFRNKLVFILPALLVLSELLPWLLTPLLMVGGAYLCFEGAEKLWEKFGPGHHAPKKPAAAPDGPDEDAVVSGAVRTDFILSAEIMVISLNEVATEGLLSRAIILAVVAVGITVLVYGVVALIVRMDDIGLSLAERESPGTQRVGRALVKGMPKVMALLATVGVAAMLWVGGHILLVGTHDLGWHGLYDAVHHLEELVAEASPALDGLLAWLTNTAASALLGVLVGALIVAVMHLIPRRSHA